MGRILCIETATGVCSVSLSQSGVLLNLEETTEFNSHSSKLTSFIESVMKKSECDFSELDAIAVSEGPGSYTGLRIGVSSAKGISYACNIPLIAISTLQAMANGAIQKYNSVNVNNTIYCPMIDARRMEVYSAHFDTDNNLIRDIEAEIIDENTYEDLLKERKMCFFGDGAEKCKEFFSVHSNAVFYDDIFPSAKYMTDLAYNKYQNKDFVDVAYFEPFYLKEFVAGKPKVKGLE